MLTVLIIDDENWICQLIVNTIDWNSLQMRVLGIAHDGEEGCAQICALSPDIVITDLRMPVLNGLEMIEKVRLTLPTEQQPSFIVISGYQDFEYAQKAIRFGVSDYIVKPYDEDQLYTTLASIRQKRELRDRAKQSQIEVYQRLDESLEKIRNNEFQALFSGKYNITNREEFNLRFSVQFSQNGFNGISIRADNRVGGGVSRYLLKYIADFFAASLQRIDLCQSIPYFEPNQVFLLLNYPVDIQDELSKLVQSTFQSLLNDPTINREVDLTMGFSPSPISCDVLYQRFELTKNSANCRLIMEPNRHYDLQALQIPKYPLEDLLDRNTRLQLTRAVECLDATAIDEIINTSYQNLFSSDQIHPQDLFDLYTTIVDTFCSLTQNMAIPPDKIQIPQDFLFSAVLCKRQEEFPLVLSQAIQGAVQTYQDLIRTEPSRPIQHALKYIEENYDKPIRLQDVAEQIYLTPSYFSELFKNETGINFSDYLLNYRIDIAKKLLSTSGERVKDVFYKVGYSDAKSFGKSFKKHVGLTPREYKNLFT